MRKLATSVAIVTLFLLSATPYAYSDDTKHPLGYTSTDMWLLGVSAYKPVALDHLVIPHMSQAVIRALSSHPDCTYVYYGDQFDMLIFGTLQVVVYWREGMAANIICLGDAVQ